MRRRMADHTIQKLFMNGTFNQQAGIGRTHLTLIEKDTKCCHGCGGIQIISISKNQIGAFTAGFQPDLFHVGLTGILLKHFADRC